MLIVIYENVEIFDIIENKSIDSKDIKNIVGEVVNCLLKLKEK